jgi:ribosomal protein S18 acetylase RimI-like enzyme
MNIRQIDSRDSDGVADLFDKYRVFYGQPSDKALAREYLRTRLDNNESKVFAALVGDIPVGFMQLYPNYSSIRAAKYWILNDLYVDPAYRGQRVGEALVQTAMDFAGREGAWCMELVTAADNVIAQHLYEKLGFTKQEPDTGFYTYRFLISIQNQIQ